AGMGRIYEDRASSFRDDTFIFASTDVLKDSRSRLSRNLSHADMMGYGPEAKNCMLELTYNYGITECDKGNVYAHIALGSDDVYKTAEVVKLFGGHITREPGPLPNINTRITACLDPDG
ncbi:probable lactoylglutathione lyase, chloroplastic, partial [Tanacetum coccineum]